MLVERCVESQSYHIRLIASPSLPSLLNLVLLSLHLEELRYLESLLLRPGRVEDEPQRRITTTATLPAAVSIGGKRRQRVERALTGAGFFGRSRSPTAVVPWELLVPGLLVEWDADLQELVRREVRANGGQGPAVGVQLKEVKEGF